LYYPVFLLEETISHRSRKKIKSFFGILVIISFILSATIYILEHFLNEYNYISFAEKIYGITGLVFCLWILFFVLESFYYSHFHIGKKNTKDIIIDFTLAYTIYKISPTDITAGFFGSPIGSYVLLRCGINKELFDSFLVQRKKFISEEDFVVNPKENIITWDDFILAIYEHDKELQTFLFKYGIQKNELLSVVDWIIEKDSAFYSLEWWWSNDNLSRVPSLGQDWSYGQIYTLNKYRKGIPSAMSDRYEIHSSYGVDELKEIEAILSRSRGANAMLVGDDDAGKLQIISHLGQMIKEGVVLPQLKHRTIVLFDTDSFISQNGDKISFESEFKKIMIEAVLAGNIIMVIENFPSFITSSKTLGSDIPAIIEPFLSSPYLQIIVLSDTDNFHQIIEKNVLLMQNFEKVFIKDIGNSNTIKVLENELIKFETGKLFFTYQSLVAIAESAERYFADGIMPDKAVDLLLEIIPRLKAMNKEVVLKEDVLDLVKIKTGIPVGIVSKDEKDKLLNLEKVLHQRIVGQDEAIVAISNAVRRSRSGIVNPNRPISSFLFLGPTGVGKTETTKALNEVFFGKEGHIMRLDMSEYSSIDATSKLIGSFETNHTGVLATMLHEHQYGVLLLDEFEKTTPEVMNLFLQVLDEGFFSDNFGKKINARNLIIIATSNAGSEMIWEAMKSGDDLINSKEKIIENIIKQGIFKPELLNRFDGVVVFHPLSNVHLKKISRLMLEKLHERLSENGINLVVNDTIVDYIAKYGTDPKFGARPINRAIQEKVEQIIAKKIIDGSVKKGEEIALTTQDLS
jgi:ATP-dependent Clp protease ATP-binding subunit ClpA